MKCRYSHCKHGGEVAKEDAVKEGKAYYHPDCLAEKKAINNVIKLYHEKVDPKPIESYLRKIVNDIVYNDGNDAEYLLFAFQYCLNHGWTLNSPSTLKHIAKNWYARNEWDKRNKRKVQEKIEFPKIENTETTFVYKPLKQKNIDNIFDN